MTKNSGKPNQTLKISKLILIAAQFLSFISNKLTVSFAARLFTTPIKHKLPKREVAMDQKSRQESVFIPSIKKEIVVYHYGDSPKKIGFFFHRSRRWAQNILKNYSSESFSPLVVKKRGPKRKTTEEEDQLMMQKGREKLCAPVRVLLGEQYFLAER